MEELYEKYRSDKRLVYQLNRCRMAVQTMALADITDSSGEILTSDQLDGKRPQDRRSDMEWPTVGPIKRNIGKNGRTVLWKHSAQEEQIN